MDRVRFGRALGVGTRHAIRTLVTAVDAATAENPAAKKARHNGMPGQAANAPVGGFPVAGVDAPRANARPAVDTKVSKAAHSAAKAITQARAAKRGLGRGSKRFGEAVWEPFVRLSGVLWLEVAGVFFGLFALLALGHLWKLRKAWSGSSASAASQHSMVSAAIMTAVFGYFCVSSFVRARRRERRR